jgi:hypothetical protein
MRALERNKQNIYFANYTGRSVITDDDGLETGEYELTYTQPTSVKVNVSASRGEASLDLFGTDLNYSNTIVSDKDLGIDENSILWVGKEAYASASVITPHNYKVVSVAKSLNSVVYAIRKVDVEN